MMTLVFRLNYHTLPGQSLWLKLATLLDGRAVRFQQVLPLQWINDQQWETVLDIQGTVPVLLEYSYQLRMEGNGVRLDEWAGPRTATIDPSTPQTLLLRDTWCSAGTVDYAFDTHAFKTLLPPRGPFSPPATPPDANHTFQLRMTAVPPGLAPCLLGNAAEIGGWDVQHAVPLQEIAANVWQTHLYLPTELSLEYKYGLFDPESRSAVSLEIGENRLLETRSLAAPQWTTLHDEGFRRDPSDLYHAAGIAIPVFSLRSERGLGVGEFADLKPLADWAGGVGFKLIQILPIHDTTAAHDWSDSYPYAAISAFALHPIYLRIDDLGYPMPENFTSDLTACRARLNTLEHVDYVEVMQTKTRLTRRVFEQHRNTLLSSDGFLNFLLENRDWVIPYAAYCVKRDHFGTADFSQWRSDSHFDREKIEAMATPQHAEWPEVSYHLWLQYELSRQLSDAVKHLHQRGLVLKGDLAIGIHRHAVDAWCSPHWFNLDAQAGAPPDAFSEKGQNWGFPTYRWSEMRKDHYSWWRSRFQHLGRYFDSYRIDHVLGFFRIWQIPRDQVEGIMGWFDPALPIHVDEFQDLGIPFDFHRFCHPYIHESFLWERFGATATETKKAHLKALGNGFYQLHDHVSTQRRIVDHFATLQSTDPATQGRFERMRNGLMDCASDVLFFEEPGSNGTLFHPRCLLQITRSFHELDPLTQARVNDLYIDYFHRRQENFWQASGYGKLPFLRQASPMLLCGEDLGMVPACVPDVLRELGILSLEIQCMPKSAELEFSNPAHAPYLSVVSPSTHDMPTLREWWRADPRITSNFAWQMLGDAFPPAELTGTLASLILRQHLQSPAMWAIFPMQDLLAADDSLRHPDPTAERINVPAIPDHPWRYRMHLPLEKLATAHDWNEKIAHLLQETGRADPPRASKPPGQSAKTS